MPIYAYRCPACGHDFDAMVKLGADAPVCPACGASGADKRVSAPGFVLKGGGWYRDHYGLKAGASASGSGGDSGGGASGGGGSSDG